MSLIRLLAAATIFSVLSGQEPLPDPVLTFAAAARAAEAGDAEESLDLLRGAFAAGYERPADVLADPAFATLLADPAARRTLRGLLQEFARQSRVTMVRPGEPGEALLVEGIATDGAGRPVEGAMVYAYHTDALGIYSEHGNTNPRLFVWLRSDADGRFSVRTIRPARYPGRNVEQHVHVVASASGFEERRTALGFADDPHWRGQSVPDWARPVSKGPDGVDRCEFEIRFTALPAPAPAIDFATQVRPIVDPRCGPCHFEGGVMYPALPFDRAETLQALGEKLFTRIHDPAEQALIRAWLAGK